MDLLHVRIACMVCGDDMASGKPVRGAFTLKAVDILPLPCHVMMRFRGVLFRLQAAIGFLCMATSGGRPCVSRSPSGLGPPSTLASGNLPPHRILLIMQLKVCVHSAVIVRLQPLE